MRDKRDRAREAERKAGRQICRDRDVHIHTRIQK